MVKRLVNLLIGGAIIWIAWHTVPVYWTYYTFSDAVAEAAQFAGRRNEAELRDRVLALASQHGVPLDPDALVVRIDQNVTEIRAPYTERVELLPRYRVDWAFDVKTAAWHVR